MAVATPTPNDERARLLNGLFPPVREIVRAADAAQAAWAERDLEATDRAMRALRLRVATYLEEVQR